MQHERLVTHEDTSPHLDLSNRICQKGSVSKHWSKVWSEGGDSAYHKRNSPNSATTTISATDRGGLPHHFTNRWDWGAVDGFCQILLHWVRHRSDIPPSTKPIHV